MGEGDSDSAVFAMPSNSSASIRVAAALVPFDQLRTEWSDDADGMTRVRVTPGQAAARIVLRAHHQVVLEQQAG